MAYCCAHEVRGGHHISCCWPHKARCRPRKAIFCLNRATQPPGQARDDWEIISDLLRALGADTPQTLEAIFKEMSAAVPAFEGLTLAKLGDGGIPLETATSA